MSWVLLLLLLAPLASAQSTDQRARYGYEEVAVTGWNGACSVALRHFRYPPVLRSGPVEPVWGRIGTVSLAAQAERARPDWLMQVREGSAYERSDEVSALDQLSRHGYTQAGFVERIRRAAATAGSPQELLRSTASLEVGYPAAYAGPPYVLSTVYYSPLGTCAFLLFQRPGPPPHSYKYQLVRAAGQARRRRAQAHIAGALLSYKKESDLYGALEEAATAAAMDPRLAEARYTYARMLALHGRFDEALAELRQAVLLERSYAAAARAAEDFEDLRREARFEQALRPPQGLAPLGAP